ncbi:D-alanyl-D-alanine carboxypeptidase [Candidatus Roizmanbacteria bacterium]|nr:D-alanyl-D-alanine carboxypeptidase [Candidatus Roizmanbacteria bacterium]
MRTKLVVLFFFFTLLFLFYPGDSYYFHIFAYNREVFHDPLAPKEINIQPIPRLKYPTSPDITAQGAYIVDIPTFTPIFERSGHDRFFPASTTKIVTALVVNDIYNSDDILTVKKATYEGQIMNLVLGEKITAENLLYGILVHSANDAAFTFAENKGYDTFIRLMNEKAKQIHMTGSSFENPAGLDNPNQYTTPFDLALAARELLKNKYLAKFVSTKEIVISDVDYVYFHKLTNVNKLLGEIHGIGGLKTGYTEIAGENLVSFYKKNGHQFIIVILKSEDRFNDTKNIVRWIDDNVTYFTVE